MGNATVKRVVCRLFRSFRYLYSACHTAATVKTIRSRICHLHAIYNEKIIVETYHQRVGRYRPHSVTAFFHRIFLPTNISLHGKCLRGTQPEDGPSLPIHFRILCHRHIVDGTFRALRPQALAPTDRKGPPYESPYHSRIPHSCFHIPILF